MKILFVAMQYIHSARWINQLKDSGHEIYLFDCLDKSIHSDLLWTHNISDWSCRKVPYIKGEYFLEKKFPRIYSYLEPFLKLTATEKLIEVIMELQPDLVHSLEMQSETYPLIKVRQKIPFKWAYSSWGSDLFLYQNDPIHCKKIKKVFKELDYLFTDNYRDILLAKELHFKNKVSGVFPGGGGYQLDKIQKSMAKVEDRKLILIKGYNHWAGRALNVLSALELLINDLVGYEIYVYSAHDIVVNKIDHLNKQYELDIKYSSRFSEISHEFLMEKFGAALIAIGNSISDGIPNTLLEAIIMGAFPIQSNPGKVSEDYIRNGENGFLIEDPENVGEIASHIKKALENPELIIRASKINEEIAESLAYSEVQKNVLKSYREIESEL